MNNTFWKIYYFLRNTVLISLAILALVYGFIKVIKSKASSKRVEKRPQIGHVVEVHLPTTEEIWLELPKDEGKA